MNHVKWGWVLPALLVLGSCGTPARRAPVPQSFGSNPLWRDGRVEVSTFAGSDAIDPASRDARARLVLARETSAPGGHEGGSFLMRLSLVPSASAPGEGTTTTARLEAKDLAPLEVSVTEVRGRDTTVAAASPAGPDSVRVAIATRAGAQAFALAWPDAKRPRVCWDALPVWLRQWAGEKTPFEMPVWLLPGLAAGVPPHEEPRLVDAVIRRMDGGVLETPAGRFDAIEFAVARDGEADAFWFAAGEPHVLLKVLTAGHLAFELRGTERIAAADAPR